MSTECGWTGYPHGELQEWDSPCECGLRPGHDGLHSCREECGGEWAGGLAPEPDDQEEADRG